MPFLTFRRLVALTFVAMAMTGISLAVPRAASAHLAGQLPFFRVDGRYPDFYHVQNAFITELDLPQTSVKGEYLAGRPIRFVLETNLMTVPEEQLRRTAFMTDFGDGTTTDRLASVHTYQRPGSYIVKVYSTADGQRTLIESCLLHVLPKPGYRLPEAAVTLDGRKIDDNVVTYSYTAGARLKLDATASRPGTAPIEGYFWDLADGNTSRQPKVEHTYAADISLVAPVVRVYDANGLFADAYVDMQPDDGTPLAGTSGPGQTYDGMVRRMKETVGRVFADGRTDYLMAAAVLFFAALAGSLHALTPGHGKSVMAALLIGRDSRRYRDVAIIAAAVTMTHTVVIFGLGAAFLVLDIDRSIGSLMPYFVAVSGLIALGLAFSLLRSGWQRMRQRRQHLAAHANGSGHVHDDESHDHGHDYRQRRHGAWGLFLAGASGGIVPCLDALSLLLLSAGLGHVAFGMGIVFSFSIGLAAAIFIIGVLLLAGKARLESYDRIGQTAAVYAPLVSGGLIAIVALVVLANLL